jgi:hypothetical protein
MMVIPLPTVFCGSWIFLPAVANNSKPIKAKKHELKHFAKLPNESWE